MFWRTVRDLKFIQIVTRVKLKILKPKIYNTKALEVCHIQNGFLAPARRLPKMIGPTTFHLLNSTGNICEIGWNSNLRSKLWNYNLHYFDDLNCTAANDRVNWHLAIIDTWIEDNPFGFKTGWEPYPTSLRIVNWIKWCYSGNELSNKAIKSLCVQARWLEKQLELHLLGNHLFSNAKALVFAGLFFSGKEAERFLKIGSEILSQQLDEQILPDGGHFELSTMYHALAFEDVLDLINLLTMKKIVLGANELSLLNKLKFSAEKMSFWLNTMSFPDQKISFFNDAAFEIAPSNTELFQYAKRTGVTNRAKKHGITDLRDSGYVRLDTGNAVIIYDAANIGPAHLPGHAHADTLSCEFAFKNHRVLVNSGTSSYQDPVVRNFERGTTAHNTVSINGEDSSEIWSSFRVGRKAKITQRDVSTSASGSLKAIASHEGYSKKYNGLIHSRDVELGDGFLTLTDQLTINIRAEAFYYLHPTCKLLTLGSNNGIIYTADLSRITWEIIGASAVTIEDTYWRPRFGEKQPNKCIVATFKDSLCELKLSWHQSNTIK